MRVLMNEVMQIEHEGRDMPITMKSKAEVETPEMQLKIKITFQALATPSSKT